MWGNFLQKVPPRPLGASTRQRNLPCGKRNRFAVKYLLCKCEMFACANEEKEKDSKYAILVCFYFL